MRFGLGLFNKKRINLIIQDHVIRYLDMRQPELLEVKSSGERYLPEGIIQDGTITDRETLLTILEECVEEWGIKGREVQFLIPDSKLVIRKHHIPSEYKVEEIKGYLYLELGSTIHLPFEDPVFDYVLLETGEEKKEILLFAASEQMVNDYSTLLTSAKLKPVVADASCVALYRLIYLKQLTSEEDHTLCLQFDIPAIQLSVFHNHKPYFFNHLKLEMDYKSWNFKHHSTGIQQLQWQGDAGFIHGLVEDKLLEIDRIINYYKFTINNGQQGITKVIISGELPELSYIQDRLKSKLNVPVLLLDQSDQQLPSQFDVVLGLGLKEVQLC
ncbi:type IV pilus biogenesis protein PilM [Fictibacillus halophilus]|uniref:type IV pilus biogenesis protein PilM n=1 Tax=Fictibacillus halophilus TaxID=1610490 RepID=UPI001CFC10C7|nr:pilus assembly protein PilM [Fictibacillus halophilus]